MTDQVIVSRNPSVIAWFREKGIEGSVLEYARIEDILHKRVYGLVPYWMGAYATNVSEITMPHLDKSDRDRFNRGELTVQEMDHAGAEIVTYQVRRQ